MQGQGLLPWRIQPPQPLLFPYSGDREHQGPLQSTPMEDWHSSCNLGLMLLRKRTAFFTWEDLEVQKRQEQEW